MVKVVNIFMTFKSIRCSFKLLEVQLHQYLSDISTQGFFFFFGGGWGVGGIV